METLRFAPIVRVSTEKQEKQGESLTTQKAQIIQYVGLLHGTIPDHCWQYSGQEHATPDQERKRLEKLLSDSDKGIFDAVIVCDASRWSRDNLKSKEGLKILRKNNIRFFVSTMEYNLDNPEHSFYLGISAEIGEFQARQGSLKSITNRINKARRGVPASGLLPYGRTFDKTTETWGIDPDKKHIIEQCAERYLKGESFKTIALSYNMDYTNLHTILTKFCGTDWHCRFRYENIDESVTIQIPRLLEEDVIEAIHNKALSKRTYDYKTVKNTYLLSRMVFCKHCEFRMTGFTSASGRRYYRHARFDRLDCKKPKFVYASELENSVLIHLVSTLGDVERINNAIKQATPDISKIEGFMKEKEELSNELKKITAQKNNIVEKVSNGLLTDSDIQSSMSKLNLRNKSVVDRLHSIESELANIPSQERVNSLTKLGIAVLADISKDPKSIFKKSYKWKKNLIEHAFNGKGLGVYVEEDGKGWKFEIRGTLESTILNLPLSDDYLVETFKIDSEYSDFDKELQSIRSSINDEARQLLFQYRRTFRLTVLR